MNTPSLVHHHHQCITSPIILPFPFQYERVGRRLPNHRPTLFGFECSRIFIPCSLPVYLGCIFLHFIQHSWSSTILDKHYVGFRSKESNTMLIFNQGDWTICQFFYPDSSNILFLFEKGVWGWWRRSWMGWGGNCLLEGREKSRN